MRTNAYITVHAAAAALGVRPETLRRWIGRGQLRAVRVGPRGWWRVPREAVERLAERKS